MTDTAFPIQEVQSRPDFPALERDVLAWWHRAGIVHKYLHRNDGAAERYSFLDGPITANNPMGVHHAWGRTYKDLFQRYQTMLGKEQRYQNGFDCQGLWVEVEVEKELGLTNKRDIESLGIADFVERCKQRVLRFADRITDQSIRLGYWVDWDHSYFTMSEENNYTIWYFLKSVHDRGWLYKGHDVMPWCPRCGTGISEHEIVTEGYQERTHYSVYVALPLLDEPDASLLVWTTTPWTLPANIAAAVHPDLVYVLANVNGQKFYVAKEAAKSALRGESTIEKRSAAPTWSAVATADHLMNFRFKSKSSTASSPGTTSTPRKVPASSTSRRAPGAIEDDAGTFTASTSSPGDDAVLDFDLNRKFIKWSAVVDARSRRRPFDELPVQVEVEHRVIAWDDVEPRKGHRQVVEAFDALWQSGVDLDLVIVGKKGWMVEELATAIMAHRAFGQRLF